MTRHLLFTMPTKSNYNFYAELSTGLQNSPIFLCLFCNLKATELCKEKNAQRLQREVTDAVDRDDVIMFNTCLIIVNVQLQSKIQLFFLMPVTFVLANHYQMLRFFRNAKQSELPFNGKHSQHNATEESMQLMCY